MKKSIRLFIITIFLSISAMFPVFAGNIDPVLAKVLLTVVRNTNWNQKNLTICTYGSSRLGSILQAATVDFQPSENVRKISVLDQIEKKDFGKCQVLYIVPDKEDELAAILKSLGTKYVMTVSDMEDFTENGGMVGISIGRRNNLVIQFNEEAVSKANVRIDPVFVLGH